METTKTKSKAIQWLESEYLRKDGTSTLELIYIDYRDSIEDAKKREELLQDPENDWEIIDANNWTHDAQFETLDYISKEYQKSLPDGEEVPDETWEEMREWCYDHDTSTVVKDLLKNTGSEYLYYDTGLEIEGLSTYDTEKDITRNGKAIAKKLKLDYKKHENDLRTLCAQAWDGGQLVVLFTGAVGNFLEDAKYIHFKGNASICIMNRFQGSGDHVELGEEMTFIFDRKNLHSDEGDNGYSYTSDTCGLIGGLYEDGELTNKKRAGTIKVETNEEADARRERENRYIANWDRGRGKCTAGDMNIKRHKNTPYRNDYPCGSKCEECGTFWID